MSQDGTGNGEAMRRRIRDEIDDSFDDAALRQMLDTLFSAKPAAIVHTDSVRPDWRLLAAAEHAEVAVFGSELPSATIINNLRPAVLDLGLAAAFEWQVAEFRRRSGIACNLVMDEDELNVDDTRATTLFRILQESLTNVIRHSKATRVVIELNKDGDKLVMKITDNGVGIYPGSRKGGNSFGLVGVEERIHALNGRFIINSTPGNGTTLTIFIPLPATEDELQRVASR